MSDSPLLCALIKREVQEERGMGEKCKKQMGKRGVDIEKKKGEKAWERKDEGKRRKTRESREGGGEKEA